MNKGIDIPTEVARFSFQKYDNLMMEIEKGELKDVWSADGAIFYHHSKAYGVNKNLKTVCVGDRDEIIKKYPLEKASHKFRLRHKINF